MREIVSAISSASVASAFLMSSSANGSRVPAVADPRPLRRVSMRRYPSSISIVSQAIRRTLPSGRDHRRAVVLLDQQRPCASTLPAHRSGRDRRGRSSRAPGRNRLVALPPAWSRRRSKRSAARARRTTRGRARSDADVHRPPPPLRTSDSRIAARARPRRHGAARAALWSRATGTVSSELAPNSADRRSARTPWSAGAKPSAREGFRALGRELREAACIHAEASSRRAAACRCGRSGARLRETACRAR